MDIATPVNPNPTIAVVGMATVDYLYVLSTYPGEDTETPVLHHHVCVGGPAGRGAIAAARLGAKVRLLATCGIGPHAETLRSEMDAEGVAGSWIVTQQPSQHSAVIVAADRATRSTIWLRQPRADERALEAIPALLDGVDVVLLDCTDEGLSRAVVEEARRQRLTTVIDTGSFKPHSVALLPDVDHVIAPAKWFAAIDPEFQANDMTKWSEKARKVVAATTGDQGGCYARVDDGVTHSWAAVPVRAVDTCGAGDTFHGAYSWAVGAGLGIQDCFSVAAWSAGLKSTAIGNSAIPSWPQIQAAASAP